jgi:hypothetical protein
LYIPRNALLSVCIVNYYLPSFDARVRTGTVTSTTTTTTLSMASNGSSVNTANIITALGNAFKDPSGAALPDDRLAAVLIQNMKQLNDLAKQGKLNQQQIMQVRS